MTDMPHKTVSCSFADCRNPSYARWNRLTVVTPYDELVNTTFLACRDHDRALDGYDAMSGWGMFRIGLYQDEQCLHHKIPPYREGP